MRQQRIGIHRGAIDAAALLEVHEMRLGVQADPVTRLQGDGLQHGAAGALAVGAGHGDDRNVEVDVQALQQRTHGLQRPLHRARVQTLAVGEPILERGGCSQGEF